MIKFKKVLSTRLISLILVVVLSIPATAYGTDLSNRSNLRPPPATSSPAGRERLRETLSEVTYHEHVNKHINPQAEALYQDFLKSKGIASNPENIALFYDGLEKYPDSDIAIMEIANLYKNTRILEHIGLGRFYGRPIIYIDKSLKGKEKEKILQHAYDEITGWGKERGLLSLEWPEMRNAILADYENFQKIADRIHSKSHKIDNILKKYEAEHKSDLLTVIASMPFKKVPRDVVIAAGIGRINLPAGITLEEVTPEELERLKGWGFGKTISAWYRADIPFWTLISHGDVMLLSSISGYRDEPKSIEFASRNTDPPRIIVLWDENTMQFSVRDGMHRLGAALINEAEVVEVYLGIIKKDFHIFGSPQAVFNLLSKGQTLTRQQIASALNRSVRTIEPDLRFLVSAGLLIQKGRGEKATYVINPELSKNPDLISGIQGILDKEFQHGKIVKSLGDQEERERIRERILKETLSEVTYHEHVNKHINPQAEALYQDFLKSKGIASNPENIALFYDGLEKYPDSDIAIMEIANLYKNTRILEHIGLGRFYGRPIIYIDKSLKGKEREKILQHAYDEITGWDEERQSLGLEWPQMREQILQDYEKFKKIAGRIHSKSNKIDAILKKYEAEHTSDLLTVIASMPFKEGDVVIAAGNKPLENLKWPFEIPKIDYIAHGKSYFLKSRYSKGAFYIGLTNKAIEDLDKLKRIAERNKKFETGAFGIGLVSSNYRFIVIERLVLPRKVKFVQKSTDLASDEQLEFMAGDADVLVEPNGVYYTTKYREYAQRQGRIVIEAHSHLPHTNTLKTKGRWPTESDMQALRRGIIPVGGIIHNEGYTFYHVSQNDEEIAGNTIPDLPSRKRHFLFGSPQSVFYKLQKYPGQPKTRKYIAKALGRSMLTIEPDLRFLVSAGLLIQEGRGEKATYVINPELSKNPALITRIQNILDTEFKVLKTGWENKVKIREMIFEEALKDNLYLAPVLKPMRNARDQI